MYNAYFGRDISPAEQDAINKAANDASTAAQLAGKSQAEILAATQQAVDIVGGKIADPNQVTLRTDSSPTPSSQSVAALSSGIPNATVIGAQNLGYTGDPRNVDAAQNFINANLPLVGTMTPTNTPINPIIPTGTVAPSNGNFTGTINSTGGVDPYQQVFIDTVLNNAAALGFTGTDPQAAQQFLNEQYTASLGSKEAENVATVASRIAAENANKATTGTTPSGQTVSNLGGTGTVVDTSKINTQGGTGVLSTSDVNKIATTGTSALATSDVNKIATSPVATSSPNAINTGGIPALTTADLASWSKTLPQGLTSDQLTAALNTNQTALSKQNEDFLKNWTTQANTLKSDILSGVDTKNQQFGTQATQGFMDAFKNFQIPTNQQTGVNLGNYNDNRNAAADQWWSQYVTGRR
jgi:hypothetical protein